MIKRVVIILLTVGLIFPFPIFSAMIGEFAVVNGNVTVKRAGKIITPKVKDKVETLDFIQTGKNSNARVVLTDATAMALGPNSRLEMKQFTVQGGKTTGLFSVPVGLVQTNVAKALGPGSKFEIQTPTAIAGVRGTAWITLVQAVAQAGAAGSQSTFYALSQSIFVLNPALPAQVATIAAGNFTVVAAGVAPTVAAAFAPAVVTGLTTQLGAAAIPGVSAAGATGAAGTSAATTTTGTAATGTATGSTAGAAGAATGSTAAATGTAAGAGTATGTAAGAAGAGTAAGAATVAGVGVGTVAIGAVAAAVIVGAVVASSSKNESTTTHSSTPSNH